MAPNAIVQLSSVCAAASFFYIFQSLERHSLTESPRLSSFLVFLLSGGICYGLSYLTKWLPGANGRFNAPQQRAYHAPLLDGAGKETSNGPNPYMPKRPRRLSLPLLVMCIVFRLEIFHRVNYQQQCSTPGVESFLCMALFMYEVFATRRKWGVPPAEDPDDPWRSCFDDIYEWFTGPRVALTIAFMSALMFSTATYNIVSQAMPSTYVCFSPLESRRTTLLLQYMGLILDAVIVVLLWRTLSWSRGAKLRLRTLASILALSSLCMGMIWFGHRLFTGSKVLHAGFGFLYGFDIIVDSFAFAVLMVSATLWVCETSPLTPSSIVTWLVGIVGACDNIYRYGDYLHSSRAAIVFPLYFVSIGFIIFAYCHDLRSILYIRRFFLVAILFGLAVGTTVYIIIESPQSFAKRHPLDDFIYKASIRHDKWLRQASVSGSLPVAVKIYQEHHGAKNPPPNFDEWYELAKNTVVVDQFDQIENDIRPFAAMSPKALRKRITRVAELPGVHTIKIKNGKASGSLAAGTDKSGEFDLLVGMINKFSQSLPDMVLPINLRAAPRVLPSWEVANGLSHVDLAPIVNLVTRDTKENEKLNETAEFVETRDDPTLLAPKGSLISPTDYREMQVDGCAPGSRTRTNPYWHIGEFCSGCIRRHSKGPLMVNWDRSMEFCAQADIKYLHGMSLTWPNEEPIRDLLPLFGSSKAEPFQDILIPIPTAKADRPDIDWDWRRRYDTLFWRGQLEEGAISDQALRGSPKFRLLNMMNHANPDDEIVMVLPLDAKGTKYGYEKVSLFEANRVIPFSMGISNYTGCVGHNCYLVREVYGSRESEEQEPLEYRYVLVMDEDRGPPREFLRMLHSQSVPFLATMFRTWYTERLTPWLHFVPIDVRFQSLHTTFSFFTGTEKRSKVNGRDTNIPAHGKDAMWIGHQGSQWAKDALGEKDMEVYLFRLLLEWGRLVDDKRDDIGFSKGKTGEYQSDAWSQNMEW